MQGVHFVHYGLPNLDERFTHLAMQPPDAEGRAAMRRCIAESYPP